MYVFSINHQLIGNRELAGRSLKTFLVECWWRAGCPLGAVHQHSTRKVFSGACGPQSRLPFISYKAYCTPNQIFVCGSMVLYFFCRFFSPRRAKKNLQKGRIMEKSDQAR